MRRLIAIVFLAVRSILFLILLTSTAVAQPWFFPKNQLSLGYYNRGFIYLDCPHPPSPIFWEATTKVSNGLQLVYQRLLYHSRKRFSVSLVANLSRYSFGGHVLYAQSLAPVLQYWFLRSPKVSAYFAYSIAGPTLMNRRTVGDNDLGGYFIFQDFIGFGLLAGHRRGFSLDLRLVHYSNGDILPKNPGFDVPIMVYLGYRF